MVIGLVFANYRVKTIITIEKREERSRDERENF